MRFFFTICGCLAGLISSSFAAEVTALDALKLLPKEQRARVVRIEARDGAPEPERWHILVSDPAAENGLKEFVVANGAIVAERGVSQFAESLASEPMLGDNMRFDSDRAAQLAQQFAQVNAVLLGTIAYQLRKDAATDLPMWRLTCFDKSGKEAGVLTLTATKGWVMSNPGFTLEPPSVRAEKAKDKTRTVAVATTPVPAPRDRTVPTVAEPPPAKKPSFMQRLFGGGRSQ